MEEILTMVEKPGDYPIHTAVKNHNYKFLKELLLDPKTDINKQNHKGETALHLCVKYDRPLIYMECLLEKQCDVLICNKKGKSPLYLSIIKHDYDCTKLLIKYIGDVLLNNISGRLLRAIKKAICIYQFLIMHQGQQILVCSANLNDIWFEFYEINVFIEQIELIKKTGVDLSYTFGHLICNSLELPDATVFKLLWNKFDSDILEKHSENLLALYHNECSFNNSEYIECLCLILTSIDVLDSFKSSGPPDMDANNYRQMLRMFDSRGIQLHGRMSAMLCSLKVVEATMWDMKSAYSLFGFNEEFVLFADCFEGHVVSTDNYREYMPLLKLISKLVKDPDLSLQKIQNLGLVPKRSYLKLINLIPNVTDESLRIRKEILGGIPTLYELSKYHSQKYIQRFYKIQEVDEFCKIVRNLGLPNFIMESLCKNPPIYYEL